MVMAACPLLTMMYLCTTDLVPFSTAIALIVNLAIKQELSSCLPWYPLHQLALICLGGAYERIILSDYFSKTKHGRSFWFWMGEPLQEVAFNNADMTSFGKLLRRCRNLICQMSLIIVLVIDPLLALFDTIHHELVISMIVKIFIVLVPLLYSHCLMIEEAR